jgi:hypothetical protein
MFADGRPGAHARCERTMLWLSSYAPTTSAHTHILYAWGQVHAPVCCFLQALHRDVPRAMRSHHRLQPLWSHSLCLRTRWQPWDPQTFDCRYGAPCTPSRNTSGRETSCWLSWICKQEIWSACRQRTRRSVWLCRYVPTHHNALTWQRRVVNLSLSTCSGEAWQSNCA